MAKVQKTVITALGEQMLFSSALTYTNATLCSQDISNLTIDQLRSLTYLTGKVLSSPISAHKRQGNTKADQVDVQVTFTNQDQKADINYSSIGWFARDHQGQETLIAVTPFIGTDTIAAAPPDGTATSSKNITLSMAAGTATEINVLIDPAGSVTPSTFNAEVDKINEALALKADNAELADYAKKADVNSALDAKADKTALDSLAKSEDVAKDVETLNSAINLKADKTDLAPLAKTEDVNTELDKKADKTALDDYAKSSDVAADVKQLSDSIETKADAKTVDDAIGKIDFTPYAKTADVQAGLDTKADKTALDAYAKSADVANDVNTLQDNINAKADAQTVSDAISKIDLTPFAKTADVNSALSGKADKVTIDAINKALASKRDITDSYSRDELDKKFLQLSADTGGKVSADQVSKLIAGKADQDDVDKKIKAVTDAVNTKADKTDVTAQFATKADKTTVESDLATKADQSSLDETNAEVAKKANSEDVTKQLATKANVSNVDDALSKKDNTADVDAKIKTVTDLANTKANASDVYNKQAIDTAFSQRDSNLTTLQNNLQGQIDKQVNSTWAIDNNSGKFNAVKVDASGNSTQSFTQPGLDLLNSQVDKINQLKGNRVVDAVDFNTLTDTGVYYVTNSNSSNKNAPVPQWGTLVVSNGNDHRLSQVYFPDDNNAPWYRTKDEGNWLGWQQLSTKSDVNNAVNSANSASARIDTVLGNSYFRKRGMNANGDLVEIRGNATKQTNGGYAFDIWPSDWTASKLKDVLGQLPGKANTTDVNNVLNGKANTGDVTALQGKVNVTTPLFREISADSTWEDIFGVTNPTNVLTSLRINPGGNGQLVNDYAAGIGFGGNDTKAVISVDYGSHVARFTAGNGTSPGWSEDVAWKSDISSLTQALTKLQAAFDAQQTKIAALQATVNNQANQLTYFKQHYIEGKAFDADQIKQAMAWTGDDGQKLAIIRDKENEGGK